MPLVAASIKTFALAKAASKAMTGSKLSPMVSAVAKASVQHLMSSAMVNSTNIVTGPGAGTSTGTIQGLVPSLMSKLMQLKGIGSGMTGKDLKTLCDVISAGVVQAITSVVVQGTVIGGGPGTGTGKVSALVPSALKGFILLNMASSGLTGSKSPALASALATGICNHIMTTGTVQLVNVGAFAPPPAGPIPIVAAVGVARWA